MSEKKKANVHFLNARASHMNESLVVKMMAVAEAGGLDDIIDSGDVVGIKLHMGEWNNTAYIRPVYVRQLVDKVKALGGRPFVTDCTCLPYTPFASRTTALDYRLTCERNGFTTGALGAPVIIADGWLGNDDVRIDLPEGVILKEQYVGAAIAHCDALIVLTHFKGHPMGTFGGSIKNIGVGCASKRGKLNLHMGQHPNYGASAGEYYPDMCKGEDCSKLKQCLESCPTEALEIRDNKMFWHKERCIGCWGHIFASMCPTFLGMNLRDGLEATNAAIADSALATVKTVGRDKIFFINLLIDVTPWCDCVAWSDSQIIPDVGVFASNDIVAVDKACLDMARESPGMKDSMAEMKGALEQGVAKFASCGSILSVSENIQINTGVLNGMGTQQYRIKHAKKIPDLRYNLIQQPIGVPLRKALKLQWLIPADGFKREDEIDLERLRWPLEE
ncbi:MAG: DUF362 domain-containing protein [Candidatus Helarchaeota archaeon]|nr:DUF362 domain-containing protein [Candidatus Helarchaeota archaeon]